MKPDPTSTCAVTERPLPPSQFALPEEPSLADQSSTIALDGNLDPAARVMAQMDGLAASLERETAGARGTQLHPSLHAAGTHAAEEECLESYLQQYMQRLTGKSQSEPPPTAPVRETAPVQAAPPDEDRLPKPAPEHREQLTAMRALANDSARQVMAESSHSLQIVKIRWAYCGAQGASIASTGLAIAFFATHSTIVFTGAALLFTAAVLLCCRLMRLCAASAS